MRIVYIHQYFGLPSMPGGLRSYEFARRLVEAGHTVDVITTARSGQAYPPLTAKKWTVTREAGITVHWCAIRYSNHMPYSDRLRAFAQFAVRGARRARSIPADLVFATSTPLTVAIPAVYAASRGRIPMVFEVRDVWPEVPIALGALKNPLARRAAYALEAWAYRHAKHVVALSPDMAASITRRFPGTPVTVIPNSSDANLFSSDSGRAEAFRAARPWLGDRPLLVYAGTFGLVNGLSYAVDMAVALQSVAPEVRVLLVGQGREERALRELAERHGVLGRNLFIEPPIAKHDVPTLLSAADMCISTVIDVPELSANSANKAFDSFAAGRPLLVNHGGWLADIVKDCGAGLVVPPTDPTAAATAVAAALGSAEWMDRARTAATALAQGQFNRETLAQQFEQVLVAAAGAREGTRPASSRQAS